jgi:hypothetical protein
MEKNGKEGRGATGGNLQVEGGETEDPCAAGFAVRPDHAVTDPRLHVFPYVYRSSFGDAMCTNVSHRSDAVGDLSDAQKATNKAMAPRRTLKMLTAQFLGEYGRLNGTKIHVDTAADRLNTVRRRMYDIMAVCMEIGLVSKSGKAQYTWQGEAAARKTVDAIVHNASNTKSVLFKDGKKPQSLRGLTRGMVAFMSQTRDGSFIEVDHVAMNVLNIDSRDSGVKHKLRRAYDVVSVLSALKMVVEGPAQANVGVKPKRCLSWKGVDGILSAIEEAEKIDFGSNSFSEYDAGTYPSAPNNTMLFNMPSINMNMSNPYHHMPPGFFHLTGPPPSTSGAMHRIIHSVSGTNNLITDNKVSSTMYPQQMFPSHAYTAPPIGTTGGPFPTPSLQPEAVPILGTNIFNGGGSSATDQHNLMQYMAAFGAPPPSDGALLLPIQQNNGTNTTDE